MADSYVVFGGTFDPPHAGHLSVLHYLLNDFDRIIIAPTAQNPWKDTPSASFTQRTQMIELLLEAEDIPYGSNFETASVIVSKHPYVYSKDFVQHCRSSYPGKIHWAVGEDSAASVSSWKNWDTVAVPLVVAPVKIDVHSTALRENRADIHPALQRFIVEHGLYQS